MSEAELEKRAFEDAMRDMADEGLEPEIDPLEMFENAPRVFHSAFSVYNVNSETTETYIFSCFANDPDEAAGITYGYARKHYPASEGYRSPDIDVDRRPAILVGNILCAFGEGE